ncbi:hypothetical protein [Spirosoma radiotolerans]|uniref:Uncharacterized protein n=1 Tax=Spirosoma radiotolerans TaxID=1379870 RepID=A0A0E3ZYW3_9BACT|nr:hypothetical protein [Spirosoma radiotolerans]AKD57259.1 hypothetical protein SD10_22560 [Spirosoma radiotolerans]
MKKAISIGLFGLLLHHILAYVLVCVGTWWQAEHDLSQRLQVYRSVDSIVEFQIPLKDKPDANSITRTTSDGFTYRGQYYSVVSMSIQGDTLFIASLQTNNDSFWQGDLLSFMQEHVSGAGKSPDKTNTLLKLLLKEYSPTPRITFYFSSPRWHNDIRIPEKPFLCHQLALRISSPPPEV